MASIRSGIGENMKESEAIREVRFNMSKIGLSDKAAKRVVEARNMAIKALEKQIPKKPIIKHINTSEEATEIEYTCPVCGTNFVELTPCKEWCPYCGNKIYWSDEE